GDRGPPEHRRRAVPAAAAATPRGPRGPLVGRGPGSAPRVSGRGLGVDDATAVEGAEAATGAPQRVACRLEDRLLDVLHAPALGGEEGGDAGDVRGRHGRPGEGRVVRALPALVGPGAPRHGGEDVV